MTKMEVFVLINQLATEYGVRWKEKDHAKEYVENMRTGDSKLLVWEDDHVDIHNCIYYCSPMEMYNLHEITRVTCVGRDNYEVEHIDGKDVVSQVTYK